MTDEPLAEESDGIPEAVNKRSASEPSNMKKAAMIPKMWRSVEVPGFETSEQMLVSDTDTSPLSSGENSRSSSLSDFTFTGTKSATRVPAVFKLSDR